MESSSRFCTCLDAAQHALANMNPQWLLVVIAGASAVVAYATYLRNRARDRSKDFLDLATQQYERAFETFKERLSTQARWAGLPEPDRLLWLTVARMLRAGEKFGALIGEESHQRIHEDARSYWRAKFYVLLKGLDNAPLDYFAETADRIIGGALRDRSALSEKSLKVIADFMKWRDDEPDPITGVSEFSEAEIDRMWAFQPRGLANYIRAEQTMRVGNAQQREAVRGGWPNQPR